MTVTSAAPSSKPEAMQPVPTVLDTYVPRPRLITGNSTVTRTRLSSLDDGAARPVGLARCAGAATAGVRRAAAARGDAHAGIHRGTRDRLSPLGGVVVRRDVLER